MRRRASVAAFAAAAAITGLDAPVPAVASGEDYRTALVSRIGHDGVAADKPTTNVPAMSDDGNIVVFATTATNFPDASASSDRVYAKFLDTGKLLLVSRADGANGAAIEGAAPAISANGRHVCWVAPIMSGVGGRFSRVIVRDLVAGRTRVVPGSATDAEDPQGTPACSISDDGHKVAYTTLERQAPADTDGQADVYRHDFETGISELVSVDGDPQAGPGSLGPASDPDMTPDGRRVAFIAYASPRGSRYSPSGTAPASSVFVRDVVDKRLIRVSLPDGCDGTTPAFADADYAGSRWPSISDDGRLVAFQSGFLLDDDAPPPPSAVESEAAFLPVQVYLREIERCETHLVSRGSGRSGQPSDDESVFASISGDGRFIAFTSFADNLDPDVRDSRNRCDVFMRDWRKGRTALVSRATGLFGMPGSARSGYPAISHRGHRVAFASQSDNFTETPTGNVQVYARNTIPPRRKLAADLPGKPRARAAYRGGRSAGGNLILELSEAARVRLTVEPLRRNGRRVVRALPGEEGRNRVGLGGSLRPGRYRVSIAARDFNHDVGVSTAVIKVGRRRS